MARHKIKWKKLFLIILISTCVCTNGLPVEINGDVSKTVLVSDELHKEDGVFLSTTIQNTDFNYAATADQFETTTDVSLDEEPSFNYNELNGTAEEPSLSNTNFNHILRNEPVRPGQVVRTYDIEITVNGGSFNGRAIIQLQLDAASRDDDIRFHVEGLDVQSVTYGIVTLANPSPANYWVDDGVLGIEAPVSATSYIFLVEYTGVISNSGYGLYQGTFENSNYIAMNLHPTKARYVFPCMDEPTQEAIISLTFNNLGHTQIASNSLVTLSDAFTVQFAPLQGPPHRWGLLAHSFVNINNPTIGARLFVRPGLNNQDAQASVIINAVLTRLQEWTNKPLAEIHLNQNDVINIVALPDVTRDWYALSNVPIWEPHVLMTASHAVAQRKTAMIKISEAFARQWFGYVIFPENWQYQWIIDGFVTHAAFEAARAFQGQALDTDNTVIDINAIFVSEVIQESLFRDGYTIAQPLELSEDLYNEDLVRSHINGLIKYKAPAVMYMVKSLLGQSDADPNVDYVQSAARNLLVSRSMQTVNSLSFYDAINSDWMSASNPLIFDFAEFFEPWLYNANYPVVNVQLRTSGVILTQERFSFTATNQIAYQIPITYTSSVNPNFDNLQPQAVLDNNLIIDLFLDEEDWFLANLQGQGYYRVNYDAELWERILLALQDPGTRETIHPLNRATLLDDALNLARAGRLDYDVALRVALTLEHETHYSVWKAFIRNMDFIGKRLVGEQDPEDPIDPDIYLRMIRRAIGAIESSLGFYPDLLLVEDAMATMTRGLVMEYACRNGYLPCIAAAIDWFYDPNNNEVVNANIPHDIRPAVYCTMVREGGQPARDALWTLYDAEASAYERLTIVKALGCSEDEGYLTGLLQDTVSGGDRFSLEERNAFFISIAEGSPQNADLALRFLRVNTAGIRDRYGGPERLEEIINVVAANCVNFIMADTFDIWVNAINSGLDDSYESALLAAQRVQEDLNWNMIHMDYVFEWIDENDATSAAISSLLLLLSVTVTMFHL